MTTVVLLTISNVFMTIAWYGHLRHKDKALWLVSSSSQNALTVKSQGGPLESRSASPSPSS